MGAEDGSKMKSRRLGKNLKEMNREIRAKLSNINKKPRLHRGLKKVKKLAGASNRNPKAAPLPQSDSSAESKLKARRSQSLVLSVGKLDNTQRSSSINLPAPPSTLTSTPLTSTNIVSNEKPATMVSTGDGSAEKEKKATAKKGTSTVKKGQAERKYSNEELRNKIAELHKHTRTLRAEDPAVDKLIAGVDESLKAIEALDKIYNNIYQEAKVRTRQLKTEFEHLKALREQNKNDIYGQIAHQMRSEVDNRSELDQILRDIKLKSLLAQHKPSRNSDPPSFFLKMLKGIFGF